MHFPLHPTLWSIRPTSLLVWFLPRLLLLPVTCDVYICTAWSAQHVWPVRSTCSYVLENRRALLFADHCDNRKHESSSWHGITGWKSLSSRRHTSFGRNQTPSSAFAIPHCHKNLLLNIAISDKLPDGRWLIFYYSFNYFIFILWQSLVTSRGIPGMESSLKQTSVWYLRKRCAPSPIISAMLCPISG